MMRLISLAFVIVVVGCAAGLRPPAPPAPTAAAPTAAPPPAASPRATGVRARLAAQRIVQLDRLHAYAEAAVFPRDELGFPLGVFRDPAGRLCAMASLIDQSGRTDLIDTAVRIDNRLRLADVEGGPFLAWMLTSGLTQEEIALVQGALDIDFGQFEPASPAQQILAADRLVIERLYAAEAKLRAQTTASLAVAVARLDAASKLDVAGL